MRGRPVSDQSYANLVNYFNQKTQQIECECGKTVSINRLDKHKETKLHERLMSLKMRFTRITEAIKTNEDNHH